MTATSLVKTDVFEKYLNRVFVETGSYLGDGIRKALEAGFESIYSIELSEKYYNHCKIRFCDFDNIMLINGDSSDKLRDIEICNYESVTFWLDGHYSGDDTAIGESNTPLLKELAIIGSFMIKTHTILIDDLRGWSKAIHGFDTVDLMKIIKAINKDYFFTFEDGYIENDILVARCL
jgi:hypothetical protein